MAGERIKMSVEIYTTPTCGYCHQAKSYLSALGVPFVEHDVSVDNAAAEEMVRLTGQMGVPVIVVDGEAIIGFDKARLEELLVSNKRHRRFGLKVADVGKISSGTPFPGAIIGAIAPGSPAETAGLHVKDIINEVNREPIGGVADLARALGELNTGDVVSIVFLREGETRKSEIVL
jgi:glutaredoxin 3